MSCSLPSKPFSDPKDCDPHRQPKSETRQPKSWWHFTFPAALSLLVWACTPAKECEENPQADCFCTEQFDPVCGCNGQTYSNACAANCAGIASYTRGPCRGTTELDGRWRLTRIHLGDNNYRQAPEQPVVYVALSQGALNGFGGCRHFQGQYVVTERGIAIPVIHGGKSDCLEHSQFESMFMERLRTAGHYHLEGNTLIFDCGAGEQLYFERE